MVAGLFEQLAQRAGLELVWGDPGADGFYEPTLRLLPSRTSPRPIPTEGDIPMHGWKPYDDIHRERIRAHAKHSASGKSCEQMQPDDPYWDPVLGEEVGEVSNAIIETRFGSRDGYAQMRAELVQVAAMAAAWIDAIDEARR